MKKVNSKIGQIAFSVSDLRRTTSWYEDLFDFVPAGSANFTGAAVDKIVGLHGVNLSAWWLVGQQDGFQLEFFKVRNPPARARPKDWRPCDIGYTMLGIHVPDFDEVLARLAQKSQRVLTEPVGATGSRRACVLDPDGVLVEIMEDDCKPDAAVRTAASVRFVTMSVPDLQRAREFAKKGLQLVEQPHVRIHGPLHEAMWGLHRAQREAAVFDAGNLLLELVEYRAPEGKPWPNNYRVTDLGILNVAYLFENRWELNEIFRSAKSAGMRPNMPDLADLGSVLVMYGNDPLGFSLELVQISRENYLETGFLPRPCDECVALNVDIKAPAWYVWQRIADLERTSDWMGGFQSRVFREGDNERCGVGAIRELHNDSQWILEEVVQLDAGRRLVLESCRGWPTENHQTVLNCEQAPDGGTTVQYVVRFTWAHGVVEGFRPAMEAAMTADLARLKQLCENYNGPA